MAKRFSTIGLNPMVESINRKFARRIDTVIDKGFGASTYMGCSSRMVNIVGVGQKQQNVMFFRRPIKEVAAPSDDTLKVRNAFTAASKWVKKYYKDLAYISSNMQKWDQARVSPYPSIKGVRAYGFRKMRNWMFAIAYACYWQDGEVPSTGNLPAFDA